MSKHTPGPWHAEWNGDAWQIHATQTQIAEVYYGCDADKERDAPDARLIAAAPDLLAFVRYIRMTLPHYSAQVKEAITVIQKATGKS